MPRKPRAPTERETRAAFRAAVEAEGWTVSERAWPDVYCLRVDPRTERTEIMLVATPYRGSRRRITEQRELMAILAGAGIPCYEQGVDGSLIPITPNRNFKFRRRRMGGL